MRSYRIYLYDVHHDLITILCKDKIDAKSLSHLCFQTGAYFASVFYLGNFIYLYDRENGFIKKFF